MKMLTSFRSRLALVSVLVLGIALGVALTTGTGTTPVANGAENRDLPLPGSASGPQQNFVPIVRAVTPTVVNVSTTRAPRANEETATSPLQDPFFREFFGEEFLKRFGQPERRGPQRGLGSGVIVSSDGYIVTNNHVIAGADEVKVLLNDRREFTAKVIGADPPTDIAVLKIDATGLPALPWGDSNQLAVGEYVLAVGNPFALNSTVTMGIVSAVGRANVGIADYEDFIQTDAAINPGNSGGALVNTRGQLVGINTAIFSQSGGYMGIGFAVPSHMARTVMESLIKTGKVTRGFLGVTVQEITQELAKQLGLAQARGALVSDVSVNSPAAAAGIRTGDVIVSFSGRTVDGPAELRNFAAQTPPGQTVNLELIRGKERVTVPVKVAEQPTASARRGSQETIPGKTDDKSVLSGLEVRNLTPEIASQLGIPPGTTGVVVGGVAPSSPAARAGVRPGDVILEVNRQPVRSVAELKQISAKLSAKEGALLLINRGGSRLFLAVAP
jgi:serine protease Do